MPKILLNWPFRKHACGRCRRKHFVASQMHLFCNEFLEVLDDSNGQPRRCPACLAAEKAAKELEADHDTDDTKAYRAAEITMRFAAEMAAELIEKRKKNAEGK